MMNDDFPEWEPDDTADEAWVESPEWQVLPDKAGIAAIQAAPDTDAVLRIITNYLQCVPGFEFDYDQLAQFVLGVAGDGSLEGYKAACEMIMARSHDELLQMSSAMYQHEAESDGSVDAAIAHAVASTRSINELLGRTPDEA